jgi:hypothetical protein
MLDTGRKNLRHAVVLAGLLQLSSPLAYARSELPAVSSLAEQAFDAGVSTYYDEKDSSALLHVGDEHTFNPDSPQIVVIEKLFTAFQPTLVIVEGGNWPLASSAREAVSKFSEMGFVRYLAAQHNIQVRSFEPDNAAQVSFALQSHSALDVKRYLALRMVPQWRSTQTDEVLRKTMNGFLSPANSKGNFGAGMPTNAEPRSVEELDSLVRRDFGPSLDWRNADAHAGIDGLQFEQLVAIDRTINGLRNTALINCVVDAMRSGQRVFLVTGVTHLSAAMQPLARQLKEFK